MSEHKEYLHEVLVDASHVSHYLVAVANDDELKWEETSKEVYDEIAKQDKLRSNAERRQRYHNLHFCELMEDLLADAEYDSAVKSIPGKPSDLLKRIKDAADSLSRVQHRRFAMHYILGYSIPFIAELERCSKQSVSESLTRARKNFLKKFCNLP
jgi:DNA-directed RNA polymerase specialized sigma24 family protein